MVLLFRPIHEQIRKYEKRSNAKYAALDAANGVWYTFGYYSFESFLLVRTESKEDDAIDFSKISKMLPHG